MAAGRWLPLGAPNISRKSCASAVGGVEKVHHDVTQEGSVGLKHLTERITDTRPPVVEAEGWWQADGCRWVRRAIAKRDVLVLRVVLKRYTTT